MNKVESVSAHAETFSVTQAIAHFATSPIDEVAAEEAMQVVCLSLLDWIAVAVAGSTEPVSQIVRDMVVSDGGTSEASVFGSATKLPARAAALSNGATSHALDYDDTHFLHLGHPTVAVMPAALAVAEKCTASGPEFLRAALVGMETACRVGEWLGRAHYQHGFHQTATSGTFGAAAAAARLLGLDEDRTRHALGLASTKASGLKAQFGTMGKPYHAGLAAANGVEAALLAKAGFVSRPDGLECEQGFGLTHSGEQNDAALATDRLGRTYVFNEVQHKFHACCHGTHAPVEALLIARAQHGLLPEAIQRVDLTVNPRLLKVCNIERPATGLEAKFSFRLTAAMALCGYDTGALATFSQSNCEAPDLVALRDKVRVLTEEALPESAAKVRIEHTQGDPVEAYHNICDPLSMSAREAKVRTKAAALLGTANAEVCWQQIQSMTTNTAPATLQTLIEAQTR